MSHNLSHSPNRAISIAEAAQELGVSRRTIMRQIDGGNLTALKIGGVVRIRRDDWAEFLDNCRILAEENDE